MDNCEKYLEMISAMLDDELSQAEKAELMAHIAECNDCRKAYDAFKAINDELTELEPVPEGFAASVMGKIQKPKKKMIHWQRYAAVAACLVLICTAAVKALPGFDSKATAMGNMKAFSASSAEQAAPEAVAPAASAPEAEICAPMPESEIDIAPEAPFADTTLAAEPQETDFALNFACWYHEGEEAILDTRGTVANGGVATNAEFSEEQKDELKALLDEYPVEDIDFYLTSKTLKEPDDLLCSQDPLRRFSLTVTMDGETFTVEGDATAWNYTENSEDAKNFCALCDELVKILYNDPKFRSLPTPPPAL